MYCAPPSRHCQWCNSIGESRPSVYHAYLMLALPRDPSLGPKDSIMSEEESRTEEEDLSGRELQYLETQFAHFKNFCPKSPKTPKSPDAQKNHQKSHKSCRGFARLYLGEPLGLLGHPVVYEDSTHIWI
jgi:hypothetical protein